LGCSLWANDKIENVSNRTRIGNFILIGLSFKYKVKKGAATLAAP
jgi:hypothetical protein